MRWSDLTGNTKAAVIFAILGFVISFSSTSTSSINGVTTCSHSDFAALGLGALAIGAGALGEIRAVQLTTARAINLGLCGIAVVVGALHVARGLGMVGGPCAGV